MLAHIHQRLLSDSRQFAANRLWQDDLLIVDEKASNNSSFTLKPLDCISQEPRQSASIDFRRLHLLHEFAQFQDFFSKQLLNALQFAGHELCALICRTM